MARGYALSDAQKEAMNKANRQKIHLAKAQLGLDDETYKQMLKNLTHRESTADMSWRQLELVVQTLKAKGFKFTKAQKTPEQVTQKEVQS